MCLPSLCSLKQLVLTELKLAQSKYFSCFGVVLPEHLVPSSKEVRKFYHPLSDAELNHRDFLCDFGQVP